MSSISSRQVPSENMQPFYHINHNFTAVVSWMSCIPPFQVPSLKERIVINSFGSARGSTQAKNKSKKNKSDDNIDDGNEDFDDEIYVRVEEFTLSASSSPHHQATEITQDK